MMVAVATLNASCFKVQCQRLAILYCTGQGEAFYAERESNLKE